MSEKPQVIVIHLVDLMRQGYFIPGGRLGWFVVFGPQVLRSMN